MVRFHRDARRADSLRPARNQPGEPGSTAASRRRRACGMAVSWGTAPRATGRETGDRCEGRSDGRGADGRTSDRGGTGGRGPAAAGRWSAERHPRPAVTDPGYRVDTAGVLLRARPTGRPGRDHPRRDRVAARAPGDRRQPLAADRGHHLRRHRGGRRRRGDPPAGLTAPAAGPGYAPAAGPGYAPILGLRWRTCRLCRTYCPPQLQDRGDVGGARTSGRGDGGHARRGGQPTAAMISSETSKLAYTFWTSSTSSSASMRRNTLRAPSSSSGTVTLGTNDVSADS